MQNLYREVIMGNNWYLSVMELGEQFVLNYLLWARLDLTRLCNLL